MKTALIIGAGIIGLSTALELADRGLIVTVLEQGQAMQQASWAAAGMLAAHDPENPVRLAALSRFSLSLYPAFLHRVEQLSGLRVPPRTTHTLQLCHARSAGVATYGVEETRPSGATGEPLTAAEAGRRVPGFEPAAEHAYNFLWLEEQSLDPRDLCQALPIAARAAGVRIEQQSQVTSLFSDATGVGAHNAQHTYSADCLVVCSGAWTEQLLSRLHPRGPSPPQPHNSIPRQRADDGRGIYPVKGQMAVVRLDPSVPALTTVIRSPEIYLVPRGDGRIIIGATVENAGYDRDIRDSSTAWLLEQAAALWPPIRNARVEDAWTGLRPGSSDGLPLLGPASQDEHRPAIWIASGHYRNGILLAPATAHIVARALLTPRTSPGVDLTPFDPLRFTGTVAPI